MKLPKSFVSSNADNPTWLENIEKKIEEKRILRKRLEGIIKNYDLFMDMQTEWTALFDKIAVAEKIIEKMSYVKEDIEDFSRQLVLDNESKMNNSYVYFASLMHNVIKKDDILHLDFAPNDSYLDGLGMFQMRGTVNVYSNAGKNAGIFMNGGKLIIHGETQSYDVGKYMRNGEIYVYGDFSLGQIDNDCKGLIYHNSNCIWKTK